MRKSVFEKHINSLSEADLKDELNRLFDGVKEVRQYYEMELGSSDDRAKIYEKAKKQIADKFKTKSYRKPRRPRIQKLNILIKELEKSAVFPHDLIDVYLHIVEVAIDFSIDYKFASQPLFNSIIKYFEKALEQIKLCRLENEYHTRCERIYANSKFVFGVKKAIKEAYLTLYPE